MINWQYPGEEINRIIGANRYDVNDIRPQFDTELAKKYLIEGKAICAHDSPPPEVSPSVERQFLAGQVIRVYLLNTWMGGIYNWELKENGKNVDSILTYVRQHTCNTTSCLCEIREIEQVVYATNKKGRNVRCKSGPGSHSEPVISLLSLHDIVCTEVSVAEKSCRTEPINRCEFRIYDDQDKVVYARDNENCPQVWLNEPECPPDTCEVECGSYICCYNPNTGIAVTQEPR